MVPRLVRAVGFVTMFAGVPCPALAQSAGAEASCVAAPHRQFDFWIGEWDVYTPDGAKAGGNTITSILGGCALQENWVSASGGGGHSYNIYDARRDRWHQTWVDGQGTLLVLEGGLQHGRMVLRGERLGRDGQPVLDEISWEPLEGGRVRQLWRASGDGGQSWRLVFDGTYVPRGRPMR